MHAIESVKVSIVKIAFVIMAMVQRIFQVRLSVWKELKNTIIDMYGYSVVMRAVLLVLKRINPGVGLR